MDTRANKEAGKRIPIHKKGTKVVGVDCHPVDSDLFITCGNDHMVRSPKFVYAYFISMLSSPALCILALSMLFASLSQTFNLIFYY